MQFFLDMADNPFLASGLAAGVLGSIACGIIGPYVLARRIVFLSGAVAHVAIGGVGASLFISSIAPDLFGWVDPLHGALIFAAVAAVAVALVQHYAAERADMAIGAVWAVGMASGILLAKLTPGYHTELMGYLFGNISYVGRADLWLIGSVDVLLAVAVLLFHKRLLAGCLDEEQVRLQGVSVLGTNILLLVLVAGVVVCLARVVGLVLVLAMLTLPVAVAGRMTSRLSSMIWLAVGICLVVTTLPRVAVYGTRISPEAAIVLTAAAVYLVALGVCGARHLIPYAPHRSWRNSQTVQP